MGLFALHFAFVLLLFTSFVDCFVCLDLLAGQVVRLVCACIV